MGNKVFNNLNSFFTTISYNPNTGILTVSNDDNSNSVDIEVIEKLDYNNLQNKPEIYVESGEPTSVLSEDSVHIDLDTGNVWVGVNGQNIHTRNPDMNPLILDKFEGLTNDYTGKIVRAKDGNLYTQIVDIPTIEPTEFEFINNPTLDTNLTIFDDNPLFEYSTVDKIYYLDKNVLGIIDENANTIYSYNKEEDEISIAYIGNNLPTINSSYISTNGNVLTLSGTTYSFDLTANSTVKPYYDSVVVLDEDSLLILEPAGSIIEAIDIEYLLESIKDDINYSKFMYIDGLLCFISKTQNRYYVVDLVKRTIQHNDVTFELSNKEGVLLDNGYMYFIQDNKHIYGFQALDIQWKRMSINDILPSNFCNSRKYTDVMVINNNIISSIPNANGTELVKEVTSCNGHIFMVEENNPTVVSRVSGITTMLSTTKISSSSLTHNIIGITVISNTVLVATVENKIYVLSYDLSEVQNTIDINDRVEGDIIDISSIGTEVYVLTNSNNLYIFNDLEENPQTVYTLPISGGNSKICIFNSYSFAITDIDGTATGVYEGRISKLDELQLTMRVIIPKNNYTNIFMYLGKLAVMNKDVNTDTYLYNVDTKLRRL